MSINQTDYTVKELLCMLLVYEGESLNVDTSEFVVSASGGVILRKVNPQCETDIGNLHILLVSHVFRESLVV